MSSTADLDDLIGYTNKILEKILARIEKIEKLLVGGSNTEKKERI